MLLLSIKWKLLLLQMLAISKFNFETISFETLCVFRTLEAKILLVLCILHLAAVFKILCNTTYLWCCLIIHLFLRELLLCQIDLLQMLVQYKTRDHLKWHQENIWTWSLPFFNWLLKFDLLFSVKLSILSLTTITLLLLYTLEFVATLYDFSPGTILRLWKVCCCSGN